MKRFAGCACLCAVLAISSAAMAEDETQITDASIVFLYESRAKVKIPDHKVAEMVSRDYRNAKDEFTRRDVLEQLQPAFAKRIDNAKKISRVFVRAATMLGDYDFNGHAFPTGISGSSFINFANLYAVKFTNGDAVRMLPVDVEKARSLASNLRDSRRAAIVIHGTIAGVTEDGESFISRKMVLVKIRTIEVQHETGIPIGGKTL